MASRRFGHVGDADENSAKLDPATIPRFDQSHVDYLKKVFAVGAPCPFLANSVDSAVAMIAWVNQDQGNREVISHIENLLASQKGAI